MTRDGGLPVFSINSIKAATPITGANDRQSETPLEAHARLFLNTRKVVLISHKPDAQLLSLVTLRLSDGREVVADSLIRTLDEVAVTASLSQVVSKGIIARLVGKQA